MPQLVEARGRFYDLVETCDDSARTDVSWQASCQEARSIAMKPLPLPYPSAESGEMLGALLPPALRELGVSFTPPWMFVLSAGRVGVVDQPVLAPGIRQTPDIRVEPLLDLRERHKPDRLGAGLTRAMEGRKPHDLGPMQIVALLVDRGATFQDLSELLEALLVATDATPVVAILPSRNRAPIWLPLNWRMEKRILMDPIGVRLAMGPAPTLRGNLGPFSARLAAEGSGTEARDVSLGIDPSQSPGHTDLRGLYRTVAEIVRDRTDASAILTVEPNVLVGLLLNVLEALSYRVADQQFVSNAAFDAAAPLRVRGGAYSFLVRSVVLKLP